jgi:hypothetical protein
LNGVTTGKPRLQGHPDRQPPSLPVSGPANDATCEKQIPFSRIQGSFRQLLPVSTTLDHEVQLRLLVEALHLTRSMAGVVPDEMLVAVAVEDHRALAELGFEVMSGQAALRKAKLELIAKRCCAAGYPEGKPTALSQTESGGGTAQVGHREDDEAAGFDGIKQTDAGAPDVDFPHAAMPAATKQGLLPEERQQFTDVAHKQLPSSPGKVFLLVKNIEKIRFRAAYPIIPQFVTTVRVGNPRMAQANSCS